MKRILVYSPDNDPTSWYRSARPWQLLERRLNEGGPDTYSVNAGVTLVDRKKNPPNNYKIDYYSRTSGRPLSADWDHAGFYDLVFLQRPFHPDLFQAAMNFKRMGAKIWVDEDDLQTNVPWDMNSSYLYMTDDIQNAIRGCLNLADMVTASTEYLTKELQKLTKAPCETIPNAFDLDTFPRPAPKPKEKMIMWRGAAPSHQANLFSVRQPLYEVMKANPDWKLVFFGINPWWYNSEAFKNEFPDVLENIGYARHTNTLFDYYRTLEEINPAIWICPLIDNPFNRSRSNNGWADAMWVGAQCVANDFDEWKQPGCITHSFNIKQGLETAMKNFTDNKLEHVEEGWNKITKTLSLPRVNEKRLEIVKRLIG